MRALRINAAPKYWSTDDPRVDARHAREVVKPCGNDQNDAHQESGGRCLFSVLDDPCGIDVGEQIGGQDKHEVIRPSQRLQ